jgi:hypothetical protein
MKYNEGLSYVLLDSNFIQITCRNRADVDVGVLMASTPTEMLCQARFSFLLISQMYLVFCSCFHVTRLVHQSSEIRIFMKQIKNVILNVQVCLQKLGSFKTDKHIYTYTYAAVSNYRPISILNNFSKLFEFIIRDVSHYAKFNPNQHDFTRTKSTVTNLVIFLDFLTPVSVSVSLCCLFRVL